MTNDQINVMLDFPTEPVDPWDTPMSVEDTILDALDGE